MRKLVIIKKKTNKVSKKKQYRRLIQTVAAGICLAVGLMSGSNTYAREEYSYIYHSHVGNSSEQGGCYGKAVCHEHQGNEENGGECFQTPVYHVHQGSELEEGGCFTEPIYHSHSGNETEGGSCYSAITHIHTGSCYQYGECYVDSHKGKSLRTFEKHCFHHGDTSHGESVFKEYHSSCGAGVVETTHSYCRTCGIDASYTHDYKRLVCGQNESTVTGYQFQCDKTEESIDGYACSCQKDESVIDSYLLSCSKTSETIDSYERDCGWEEDVPCGKIVITNQNPQPSQEVTLHVRIEDFTGGKLVLDDEPYLWMDEEGNILGEGEEIKTKTNGIYQVSVKLKNEDVNKEHLQGTVKVDNICPPASHSDKEKEDHDDRDNQEMMPKEAEAENTIVQSPTPTPMPTLIPTPTPGSTSKGKTAKKHDSRGASSEGSTLERRKELQASEQTTPLPTDNHLLQKDKEEIKLAENEAVEEISYRPVEVHQKKTYFSETAVKVFSITAGTVFLLSGLFLLLFFFRRSVKLYNDDGEGRFIYLGRCMVKEDLEGCQIDISQALVEKSCTNRYCIRLGLFSYTKYREQECTVCKDDRRITVCLDKEITFVL